MSGPSAIARLGGWLGNGWRSELAQRFRVMLTGSVAGKLVALAAAPALTHVFAPEEFGRFALYVAILSVSTPFLCWCYDQAIVPAESDADAIGLLKISWAVAVLMATLGGGVVLWAPPVVAHALQQIGLAPFTWALVGGWLLLGVLQASSSFAVRHAAFSRVALSQAVQTAGSVVVQVVFGLLLGAGLLGLLLGHLTGVCGAIGVVLGVVFPRLNREPHSNEPTLSDGWAAILSRYRRYPLFLPWGALVDLAAPRLATFLLAGYYGHGFVGLFALGDRLLRSPVSLLVGSLSPVFLQRLSSERSRKDINRFLLGWALLSLGLSCIPFLAIWTMGGPICRVLLGPKWEPVGRLAACLVPSFTGIIVVSPISSLLLVRRRQGLLFAMQVQKLVISVGSLWFGHRVFGSGEATVLCFSFGAFISYLIYFLAVLQAGRTVLERVDQGTGSGESTRDVVR